MVKVGIATDMSSLYADINGPGAGVYQGKRLHGASFGSDNRFMKGVYVGTDGKRHRGTFAFI